MSYVYYVKINPAELARPLWSYIDIAEASAVTLELKDEPVVFKMIEQAGIKLDGLGNSADLSVESASEEGINLSVSYFSDGDEKKGYVFIPQHNVVSISTLSGDDIDEWVGKKK